MHTPTVNYVAIKATEDNIKYFNETDYDPHDFVELNRDALKIGDVVVTMALKIPDPIADQFSIRRCSHWIITEELFYEKFIIVKSKYYNDLEKTVIIQPK